MWLSGYLFSTVCHKYLSHMEWFRSVMRYVCGPKPFQFCVVYCFHPLCNFRGKSERIFLFCA
jgi:hypothetical protein